MHLIKLFITTSIFENGLLDLPKTKQEKGVALFFIKQKNQIHFLISFGKGLQLYKKNYNCFSPSSNEFKTYTLMNSQFLHCIHIYSKKKKKSLTKMCTSAIKIFINSPKHIHYIIKRKFKKIKINKDANRRGWVKHLDETTTISLYFSPQ